MRIRTHAAIAFWRKFGKISDKSPALVKQLFWFVAAHPVFKDLQVLRFLLQIGNWHLVCAPRAFHLLTIRSEERRVGKECSSLRGQQRLTKNQMISEPVIIL